MLLNNGDGTFADDVTYVVGDGAQSVAMGDLDGDLDLDLAVANQLSDDVSVLLNQCPPPRPCPWDCADGDGTVGIVDFLGLLAQWGQVGTPCDIDGGGGVGITDFLALLANWGPCP